MTTNLTKPKYVAFVDIGNAKTTLSVAKYEVREDQMIYGSIVKELSDKNLGGRDLDWALLEWLDGKV